MTGMYAGAKGRLAAAMAAAALLAGCPGESVEVASEAAAPAPAVVVGATPQPWAGSGSGSYLAARHAQKAGDLEAAAALMLRAVADDPGNLDLLERATALLIAEGRLAEAERMARRLAEAGGTDSTVAALLLAVSAIQDGDFARAGALLASLPERGINTFVVPLVQAWAQYGAGDIDGALATLAPLADQSHFAALHDFHAALIADLGDRPDLAEPMYEASLAGIGAGTLRAVQAAAGWYQRTGRNERAREVYAQYEARHPGSNLLEAAARLDAGADLPRLVRTPRHGVAEALYGAASSLRQADAFDVGLVLGRLALDLRPDFPLAQALVGDILEMRGRYDAANAVYAAIAADSPVREAADLRRARNLDAIGRTDEAVALLEDLARRDEVDPDPLTALGDILRAHKRFDEAAGAYSRAVERVRNTDRQHWSLFYSRGIAFERSGEWTRAESDFLHALELEPDQPLVLNYLGYSWVEQGINLQQAREMIEKAVALRPNDGYIVDSLGWILYRLGDFEEAVGHLERAVELVPDDPTINDHLGDALWRVGRRQEARFQWRRALAHDPEPDQIDDIRAKLDAGLEARTAAEDARR